MITTNNITAQGLNMGTMTPQASKFVDQRFSSATKHNANLLTFGVAAQTIVPIMQACIIQQNITKQSIHSASRTLYHTNKLFFYINYYLFPMFSHKLIPRSFPVTHPNNKPSMHLQGCAIIPIIQPGYSGYSSTILPLTRLLKTPIHKLDQFLITMSIDQHVVL
jgi:hypothetical protein